MRQALFDEFQQIEWRARIEAIRERLDKQRKDRQERANEQEEQANRQAEQEADRQADQDNRSGRMVTSLQWHGDRLLPAEQ